MKILLVEDEKHLSEAIVHLLKKSNYSVVPVFNGEDGYFEITSEIYDLVILDVMLPLMNGYEILKKVREENIMTPILMLTARSQIDDKVKGLDFGADDYLTKPFDTSELLARIRALSRRKAVIEKEEFTIGDFLYEKDSLSLKGKNRVQLTHLENELFELLLSRKGMITSKEQIIVKLWGFDSNAEDNNVEVYISFLRKKLAFVSDTVSIKTKRGAGYTLEVN